jgi:flagellar basal-body rod protein FlgB
MNWMDTVSSSLLNKDLDGLWVRQQAISDNMANYETPGYKAKSVSFEDQLRGQLADAGTAGENESTIGKIDDVTPVTSEASDETFRADGNGVDLEQQMIDMARTSTNYSYTLQQMNDYFTRLHTAVTGTAK